MGRVVTRQVYWTKKILESFIEEGNLNERQAYIMRTRALGYSITKQALELHLSVDQVNKEIRKLRNIYDVVQKENNCLPPRCKNLKELESRRLQEST